MARLNQEMQLVATQASHAVHQPLENQRQKLYEAIQKALKVVDTGDPAKGAETVEKVRIAIKGVQEKASAVAAGAGAARERWQTREEEFDLALVEIGELEEAEHPKAALLAQLGETIRCRVAERKYAESFTLLEQLLPKLEKYRSDHSPSDSLSIEDKESMWKELAQIEERLESLLKEYVIAC
jgi:hypothetical protein